MSYKIFHITHIDKISITYIVYFLCSNHRKYKVFQEAKSILSQYSAPNNIHNRLSYEFIIFLSIFHVYCVRFFTYFPKNRRQGMYKYLAKMRKVAGPSLWGKGGATRPAAINRRGCVAGIEIGSLNIMSRLNEPRFVHRKRKRIAARCTPSYLCRPPPRLSLTGSLRFGYVFKYARVWRGWISRSCRGPS